MTTVEERLRPRWRLLVLLSVLRLRWWLYANAAEQAAFAYSLVLVLLSAYSLVLRRPSLASAGRVARDKSHGLEKSADL